jgi:hypothetical protein
MVERVSRAPRRRSYGPLVLRLGSGSALEVDRAVSLPAVRGAGVAGVAHDRRGFLPVDEHGRVAGSHRVYAAGDATAPFPKHSMLASSQATAAAEAIAAEAGAELRPTPWSGVLYGVLALPPTSRRPGVTLARRRAAGDPLPLVAARTRRRSPPRLLPGRPRPWCQARPRVAPQRSTGRGARPRRARLPRAVARGQALGGSDAR